MKRSSYIILGAAGVLMLAAFWPRNVTSVGSDGATTGGTMDDMQAFESLADCKAASGMTAERCDREFERARENFVLTAPKYRDQAECEGQYGTGSCLPATFAGANVFVPALVGFLVARSLTGGAPTQALLPARTGVVACPPGNTLPECQPRQASSSGGGGGGSSSSGRRYSTTSGWTVFYGGGSTSRQTTVSVPRGTGWSRSSTSSSSAGRSATSSTSSVSRGGFGSTSRSFSSSS
jgi:uncharacterized protein YgiB involved in biofilm formation